MGRAGDKFTHLWIQWTFPEAFWGLDIEATEKNVTKARPCRSLVRTRQCTGTMTCRAMCRNRGVSTVPSASAAG